MAKGQIKSKGSKKGNSKHEQKISAKQQATLQGIAVHIVEAETDSRTAFDAYMQAFGKSAQELAIVAVEFDKQWEKVYAQIKGGAPKVDGLTKAMREGIVDMTMRTAYNRRSDGTAILKAFMTSAAKEQPHKMSAADFDKAVNKLVDKGTGNMRDQLVMLCRAYLSTRAGKGKSGDAAKVARIENAWKNKRSEVLESLTLQISHAPLKALITLQSVIEKRIKAIRSKAKAEVVQLRKAA